MRTRVLAAIGLLLVAAGFITMPFLATGTVSVTQAAQPPIIIVAPGIPCLNGGAPHYYFFDQDKESKGSFGPTADLVDDETVKDELHYRLCGDQFTGGDPALISVLGNLYNDRSPYPLLQPGIYSHGEVADALVQEINWSRSEVVDSVPPAYKATLYMYEDETVNDDHPMIGATKLRHPDSRFLMLYFIGSDTPVYLRLPCGFQPVFTSLEAATTFVG